VDGVSEESLLLSNLPYIPPGWSVMIELVAIFCIAIKLLKQRKLQVSHFDSLDTPEVYHDKKLIYAGLVMVALELADCIVFVLFRPKFRIAFVARTGLFFMMPQLLSLFRCIFQIVGEVVTIMAFYLGSLLLFSWVAVELFASVEGEVKGWSGEKPPLINLGFETFGSSFNTLFVAGSTADFVFVLLPTYTAFRASGILWGLFLVFVKFLLLNLVLDTLVSAYKGFTEALGESLIDQKKNGVKGAYTTLAKAIQEEGATKKELDETQIPEDVFIDLIHQLGRSPRMRTLKDAEAEVVFKAIDKDNSKMIDKLEFEKIALVLEYDFWITPMKSPLAQYVESQYMGAWPPAWAGAPRWVRVFLCFRRHYKDGNFNWFMNLVLLVNLILVVCESIYDINGWDEPGYMENLELTFSLVYVAEVALHLVVISWEEYISLRSNQFDFVVTWLLLGSSIFDEMMSSGFGGDLKRYINILRCLRLLRVLKQVLKIREVQTMVEAVSTIVSASKDIISLLVVFLLFYSALGVQMWGGILYEGNKGLEETEYDEKDWYVFNFQDVPMAAGVWVVSLISEYVQDFPDALQRVSNWPVLSKSIFISFYLLSVCIIFELVKAFTVEVFIRLKAKQKREHAQGENDHAALKEVKNQFGKQGQSLHYRLPGDPMVQEKMGEILGEVEEKAKEEEAEAELKRAVPKDQDSRQHENPQEVAS
jgi:two pore calcium channel protein